MVLPPGVDAGDAFVNLWRRYPVPDVEAYHLFLGEVGSDERGRFEFRGLPAGTYTVDVYFTLRIQFALDEHPVRPIATEVVGEALHVAVRRCQDERPTAGREVGLFFCPSYRVPGSLTSASYPCETA